VTDHRTADGVFNLEEVLEGNINEFVDALFQDEMEKT